VQHPRLGVYLVLEGAATFMATETKAIEVSCSSSDAEMNAFLTELQGETDRAAAVLGPALLDDLLRQLLSANMASPNVAQKLLAPNRPLGTFSARILAAEAFGLINALEAKDLNRLREIRNKFAHQLHGLCFADQSIRDSCTNFHSVGITFTQNPELFAAFPNEPRFTST
jgi:DNA-binding MltR family transcriptional regulator